MSWTLQTIGASSAANGSFEALGIVNPRRTLVNADIDTFSFSCPARAHDAAPLLAFGDRVRITHANGTTWFEGVCTSLPKFIDGETDGQDYEISGPWYQLGRNEFKRIWPGVTGGLSYSSHVILNYIEGGYLSTTWQMIASILDYALSIYSDAGLPAPFQYDAADILPGTGVYPPLDEVRDVLCSEALRRCLRWHPRSVLWFDYTMSPPKLHVSTAGGLTEVTIPGGNGLSTGPVSGLRLQPRYDLVAPSVFIVYEVRETLNGQDRVNFAYDVAPVGATGREEGCKNLSLDIKGASRTFSTVEITTEDIDINDIEWWKKHLAILRNSTVWKNLSLKPGSPNRIGPNDATQSLNLPREITKGTFPGWLKRNGPVQSQRDKMRAVFTYDIYQDDGVTFLEHGEMLKSVAINTTDANSVTNPTTYGSLTDAESSDPIPTDLARFIYDEIKTLQWDGSFQFTEQECTALLTPGKRVNVSGSRPEFATMNAIVQSIQEDVTNGVTQVRLAAMPGYEPRDILELIRVVRTRVRWTTPRAWDEGETQDATELGEEGADENSLIAADRATLKTLLDVASGKSVTLDTGKGVNGTPSPADAATGQTAGAAHVKVKDGAKVAQMNASNQIVFVGSGNSSSDLDLRNADILGRGPVRYMETKICVDVGGVIKQRTCIIPRSAHYIGTGDPT